MGCRSGWGADLPASTRYVCLRLAFGAPALTFRADKPQRFIRGGMLHLYSLYLSAPHAPPASHATSTALTHTAPSREEYRIPYVQAALTHRCLLSSRVRQGLLAVRVDGGCRRISPVPLHRVWKVEGIDVRLATGRHASMFRYVCVPHIPPIAFAGISSQNDQRRYVGHSTHDTYPRLIKRSQPTSRRRAAAHGHADSP